jgi:hypothetical protein
MKKGGIDTNGSNLNKNSIIKPTFNSLTKEDRKALEAYCKEVDELFFSRSEAMRQGLIQKDAAPIVIHKAEVTPNVWSNLSFSLNDVHVMINFMLER